VSLIDSPLGGLESIQVADDGHGIPYADAEALFSKLGGSWKQAHRYSRKKRRILHGKTGQGRFRAFALGRVTDWDVCYAAPDGLRQYRISMIKDRLRQVDIGDEQPSTGISTSGVTVTVSELDRQFRSLRSDEALEDLSLIFAPYLRQYPAAQIFYNGARLDPLSAQDAVASYELPAITVGDDVYPLVLDVVEWKITTQRRLYFCDANSFTVDQTHPGVQAPGFNFTAYLKSDYFAKLLANNVIDLATMDPAVDHALNSAKAALRDHFRRRAAEKAAGLVDEWQKSGVYPYHGEPKSVVEEAERQVFNVVALNVNSYLPESRMPLRPGAQNVVAGRAGS
jgi:hypothetical protein